MLGRKKRREKEKLKNSVSDKAAFGIAKVINGMQNGFANTLNKKTAKLSRRGKLTVLVLFCILFGGGSLYILVEALNSYGSSSQILNTGFISVPRHVDKTGDGAPTIKAFITTEDMKRIRSFHRYMDSLQSSIGGIGIYDSIMKARPHLMDSLTEVESIYKRDSALQKQGQ